jgi:ATP-dependent Lon protease
LGGLKDSSLLKGSDNVWVGAEPSIILKALKRMKYANGIIFFDEIDKLGETIGGYEVQSALLHITDPSQNMEFKDDFISEFPHDISKILFLFAMNDDSLLSPPLRDRLRILTVPSYSDKDKIEIMKQYLIPQALNNLGMSSTDVSLTTEGARSILSKIDKTQSEGIRTLGRIINKIISRINFLHHVTLSDGSTGELSPSFITKCPFPFAILPHHIEKLWPADQSSSSLSTSMMYL